ncbi:MAG TPA: ECF transporter S component [Anaerolineales bacterium]|nr:ECF transporter S component [Anaerolineales bacterium]
MGADPIRNNRQWHRGWVVAKSNLSLFLDTFGTMFIAIVAGPQAGALTGLVTNIIFSFISTGYAPYWLVPLLIGLVVGFFAKQDGSSTGGRSCLQDLLLHSSPLPHLHSLE